MIHHVRLSTREFYGFINRKTFSIKVQNVWFGPYDNLKIAKLKKGFDLLFSGALLHNEILSYRQIPFPASVSC
jgi:hypothetical protein